MAFRGLGSDPVGYGQPPLGDHQRAGQGPIPIRHQLDASDIIRIMVRTIISLDREDKTWLERRAREEGVSMAALVRRAVQRMRSVGDGARPTMDELLGGTAGLRGGEDGLASQRRLRSEWDGRC